MKGILSYGEDGRPCGPEQGAHGWSIFSERGGLRGGEAAAGGQDGFSAHGWAEVHVKVTASASVAACRAVARGVKVGVIGCGAGKRVCKCA